MTWASLITDPALKQPAEVRQLAAKWAMWAARANVLPLGTWNAKNTDVR